QAYGAEVVLAGAHFDEAMVEARRRLDETGATFVHAVEDEHVIAGQGAIGLELAEQLDDQVTTVLIPIGGGGLAAGTAIALRARRPELRLVGVQAGKTGPTIADGIDVKHPGELTMSILDELLDDVVHVEDERISEAITLLLERTKLVVEGAGAVGVAALLTGQAGGGGTAGAAPPRGRHRAGPPVSVLRAGGPAPRPS